LLRWSDQDGTPVGPDTFIRLAEEKGFIGELTALLIRRVTRELGDHLRRYPDFILSINIAASDLNGEQLRLLLEENVHRAGIDAKQIALELTERSTADLVIAGTAIHRLRKDGYKVHIDDFGTGYSSLSYIGQLDVNAIKIDRAFTRMIGTDAAMAPILPLLLSLAESLGVKVIVEGVETEMQTEYLESTGKPLQVQGRYFAWPMTAKALMFSYEHDFAAPEPVPDQAWEEEVHKTP
jgi:sensor c-di-GMP phosphodiesterase-like protein